jgi:hypothetical protein
MSDEPNRIDAVRASNKEALPAKVCKVCGDAIARTRRALRDWEHIQYCSAVCRRTGGAHARMAVAS